jgi:hypothetical protein
MATNVTSILENVMVGSREATLLLDGRSIRIVGDAFTPSLRALNELYAEARTEIEAHEAAEDGKVGVLRRIGALGKRLFRGFGSRRIFSGPIAGSSPAAVSGDATTAGTQRTGLGNLDNASDQPVLSGIGHRDNAIEAIFADRTGIRLLWGSPANSSKGVERKEPHGLRALTFPLDSQMGRKLQACYAEFAKLGYKVTDLHALAAEAASEKVAQNRTPAQPHRPERQPQDNQPQRQTQPATSASAAVASSRDQNGEQGRSASTLAETPSEKPPETTVRPPGDAKPLRVDNTAIDHGAAPEYIIMRPHRSSPDHPARALASVLGKPDDLQPINTPEWLLRALTAASDTAIEERKRLSFLRCIRTKAGLEIVDLGFGAKPGNDCEPAQWEEAKNWWETKGKALAELPQPNPPGRRSSEADVTPVPNRQFEPGRAPLRTGSEPAPS